MTENITREETVYSPKIKEALIPIIYQMAKAKGTRMTTLVNEILQKGLDDMEVTVDSGEKGDGTRK